MALRIIPSETTKEDKENKLDFIDKQLLKAKSYTINDNIRFGHKQYLINGTVFQETFKETQYQKFELYKLNMDDSYADNSGVSMDDDTELQVTLELVPNGFIINSNVFLTHQQWHTVYLVSEDFRRCAVCGVYCEVADHTASSRHLENMARYKPLNKYDLSITRKIKSYYHCGVCNELFNEIQQPEHFSSKTHENNLLFAINRVSDIMYDSDIHDNTQKKDSYYFNANYGQASHMLDEPIDDDDGDEYNDDWDPVNYQEYQDDEISDEEFCDEPMQNLEFSYASMARRPKGDDLPDVLEVDLGNKKVTVSFNSWNMLIRTMYNRFYCMACKDVYHVRKRGEHCRSEEHLAQLDACPVVDRYEKFFVRQVDEKCYHCGHCNNLQLIDAMEDHIHSSHTQPTTVQALLDSPKKMSSPVKTNPKAEAKTKNEETKTKNEDTKTKNEDTKTKNEQTKTKNEVKANINPAIVFDGLKAVNSNFDDLVICTFGSNIRISKLSFNIICQGVNDFYCGLCEMHIVRDLLGCHLMDVQHLTRLQRTPFILAFNVHLFRQIREALHCGLCNELIQIMPEFIIKHKYLEKHIVSMYKAVGTFKNDNKYQYNYSRDEVRDTPKILEASVPIHIPNAIKADSMTIETNEKAITKLAVNIPAPNINTKIVPVNKNISIAKVNSNKNEPSNINKNITKNLQLNKNIKENEIKVEDKEFIVVKHGVKEQESDLDDSYIEDFDLEEYVYVKLGNNYIKITNASYNSLIDVGDGTKYCFVCSTVVCELSRHVESRGHAENMAKIKFVDKYNEDLLRQFYLMYHCSICNVVITRKQLNHHLSWPTHALQTENTKISSKKRKNEIKTGTKQITVSTQKENIYLNEKEADIKIYLYITIEKDNKFERMNKIVIFNDNVFKVSFDFWHGLSEISSGYRCKVCQCEFDARELGQHVASEWHVGSLEKIEKQYSPALIRKINDATLNCIMCNTELSNKKHIIKEHIQGKKHIKNYEVMLKESSVAYSYTDCDQDFYLMYHCSICNVVITRKQLNHHLSWPTHALQTENTKISSKKRKNEIKTGTKQITVSTQKENIYLNEKEADIKIYLYITIEKDNKFERMNKIVIFNDNVFKVSFDFWHGLSEISSGYRCKVCQCEFDARELGQHVASEWHVGSLEKIEKQYSPALIRKINDATLNCIMCNTELSNKKHIIKEHIQGKKHIKNYEVMLKESSVAYSYTDCDQDVVTL